MVPTIYIAGKITGDPNYTIKFNMAAMELFNLAPSRHSITVLNPATLPGGMDPDKYMPICLAMIDAADAVFMLPDWQDSNGAKIEKAYAEYQGKAVLDGFKDFGTWLRTFGGSVKLTLCFDESKQHSGLLEED